jgi:CheY-like chemotaxis protein
MMPGGGRNGPEFMASSARASKGKILVVDDVMANRELLVQDLEDEGYLVKGASSGAEALQKAVDFIPDVFLVDVQMPGMDGFELCASIRKQEALKDSGVIFLTAHSINPEMAAEAIRHGGNDFLAKPYTHAVLLARVNSQVSLIQLRRRFKSVDSDEGLTHGP